MKVPWRKCSAVGTKQFNVLESGKFEYTVEKLCWGFWLNFEFWVSHCDIFLTVWALHWGGKLKLVFGELHKKHAVQRGFGHQLSIYSRTEKNNTNSWSSWPIAGPFGSILTASTVRPLVRPVLLDIWKSVSLFAGFKATPACPSDTSSIEMVISNDFGRIILTGKTWRTRRIPCPNSIFSITNLIWADPESNPGLRGGRPATSTTSRQTRIDTIKNLLPYFTEKAMRVHKLRLVC